MNNDKIDVQKDLLALSKIFNNAGFSLYLVGGALRDMYLGRRNYDTDVATDAKPEDVVRLFRRTIPTGIKHGTVTIRYRGNNIECTTLRREAGYSDARHPDLVEYGSSITDDLSRRDFSMNAIAASLPDGTIIDPYNGRKDIANGIIRAVGEPLMRFSEDGLRPMRAIRFASQLGFQIEEQTLQAIPLSLERMRNVSVERFQDEFNKMLRGKYFSRAMLLMHQTGVMQLFLPKLCKLSETDLSDMLDSISFLPEDALTLKLSLIAYWIYEQERKQGTEQKERLAELETMLKTLKYPNKVTEDVLRNVEQCNFAIEALKTQADIRRFLKRIGPNNVSDIFSLKKAITPSSLHDVHRLESEVGAILKNSPVLSIKELAIDGKDLLDFGISKGPKIGKILSNLLDDVIEEPSLNTREQLMQRVKKNYSMIDTF